MSRRTTLLSMGAIVAVSLAPATASAAVEVVDARVVVTPIDTGINPYHDAFQVERSSVTQDVLDEFGIDDAHVITLSATYEEDEALWRDTIQPGEDYHFTGTNIIARSFAPGDRPILPDGSNHGVGVSGSVAAANPEAVIYFLEGVSNDDAEAHAFTHTAVDIVTTSYGFPIASLTDARVNGYAGVVDHGKLHFGAATNDPQLAPLDGNSGPWWSIGISGYAEGGSEARTITSGLLPDFVADFTQDVPYCATCTEETRSVSGTSFATPRSAGVMSSVLLEVRRRAGHVGGITADGLMVAGADIAVTNWDLRRALEEGSVLIDTYLGQPAYTEIGWGAITADPQLDVVGRTLSVLFDGAGPFKDAATCDFMTDVMTSRYALWDANPLSDSFGSTNALGGSPYVAC